MFDFWRHLNLTDKDKALHKGLLKLINEADFNLKAREVRAFLEVIAWATELEKNFTRKPKPKKVNKGVS